MSNVVKLAAALLLGATVPFVANDIPLSAPLLFAAIWLITALASAVIMVVRKAGVSKAAVKSHLALLIAAGACLGGGMVLTLLAFEQMPASGVRLGLFTMPLLLTAAAPLVLRETFSSARLLCLLTSATGAVLVSGYTLNESLSLVGVLFSLGAALCFAALLVMMKKLSRVPLYETMFYVFAVAAIVMIVYTCFDGVPTVIKLDSEALIRLLVSGGVYGLLVSGLFIKANAKLFTQKVALYCYLLPAAMLIVDLIAFQTPLTTWQIIGVALIGGASVISEFISKK